ncbi:hydantoinase B/oxoprolinase family protein [Phaeovulum vinaykumarii]|uniref:5-oxoprolinase (ATP-hydrolysing) n=1 Tax=Phaeovulum vinaykumarii TaxID=407234 RepID=A0A1N7L4T2_9RHOB|nr:hydantoinase B/oxoprolinase family protein [Phaeovulum vinaykumarii]SIS68791.1 5-oxoprolinase (ATP-hydrolysing) [Phaeovulum vinaykumarii]SOB99850.1 5-oxoprolinase (ATP-hydrolysing) [Phaeovulum vinaykumarii]
MSGAWEFWIDRGGTFTDIVARTPGGDLRTAKLLSDAPEQYADAAVEGIRRLLGLAPHDPLPRDAIASVKMGTTVATNALLERRGARVLLLSTEGFGDLLEIGYQDRPQLFDLEIRRPGVLYERVAEIPGRLAADGTEIAPLDEDALRAALEAARAAGIEAVAIGFMHAWINPAHERRAADLARAAGFAQVSASHEASRLIRLVARAGTAVADACLSPVLGAHVARVARALDLGPGQLLFMQSTGGLTEAARFSGRDAILSGPAGGIVGMARTARASGFERVIGFDMGGTSTDVSHFAGQYERLFETEIAGIRLRRPMLDIHTVAAGGGSLLTFRDGRLQVGPESAGANPGPVAYRRGGRLAVTDANVLLGRLLPDHFPAVFGPAGDQPLDRDAVRAAFADLAAEVGAATGRPLSPEALAEGFLEIAVSNMAHAIRRISVERGHDLTGYALQCFGGAGGQHACAVAEALGMTRVILHPFAGVLSAYGMGLADLSETREIQADCAPEDPDLPARIDALLAEARAALIAQHVPAAAIRLRAEAHLRYEGAHQALPVPFGPPAAMRAEFETAHRARFGYLDPDRAIRVEMLGVEAAGGAADLPPPAPETPYAPAPLGRTQVHFGGWIAAQVFARADLLPGARLAGPAVITEATGTTLVLPGWRARVDGQGMLILERDGLAGQGADANAPGLPRRPDPDPVTLEVMARLFMAVAEEMGAALANTAWSVNIKERLDFSCAIFDGAGNLVANAPHVPVHLGSMSAAIGAVIAAHGATAQPGDAYVMNSPYQGGTHLPDVTVVSPVFLDGRLAFWLGARGHHADIGGRTPGSCPPDSRDIAEEGVLIPITPLMRAGRFDEAGMSARLRAGPWPARAVAQNIADLKAQVAATEAGRRALERAAAEWGVGRLIAYAGHVQDNAEALVRDRLRQVADARFTLPLDAGRRIAVAITVDRNTGTACIDFSGTSPQSDTNFNAPEAITRAVVLYVLRLLVGKPIPLNDGCLRPVRLIVPEGSILAPRPPAAVIAGNTEVSQALANALLGALGAMAASQGTMNNFTWGNAAFQNYETIGGGTGAGPGFAGCAGVQSHMTNTRMTDPEVLEARFPVRLERLAFRRGSGGAGRWPGGDGLCRRLRFLEPVTVTLLTGAREVAPFGGDGGGPGAVGINRILWPDGRVEVLAGHAMAELPAGAAVEIETPGGGGWGAP